MACHVAWPASLDVVPELLLHLNYPRNCSSSCAVKKVWTGRSCRAVRPPGPTLCSRGPQDLLAKCHPLGMFDSIATLAVASNMRELYRLVLVDTPLAPYFADTLTSEDLDEMNIEILRNTLYKVGSGRFALGPPPPGLCSSHDPSSCTSARVPEGPFSRGPFASHAAVCLPGTIASHMEPVPPA